MATGLAAQIEAAADVNFQKKVAEAMAEAAVAIYNEGSGIAGHAARATYATAVLNDPPESLTVRDPAAAPVGWVWNGGQSTGARPAKRAAAFALALACQGIDGDSDETQIRNGISSVWNALAGV